MMMTNLQVFVLVLGPQVLVLVLDLMSLYLFSGLSA